MPESLELIVIPLAVGLVVLASHVPLGRQVLARGIIFIDLAVAQAAATGALLAALLAGEDPWLNQAAALGAALSVTVLLHGFERVAPNRQEALIGASYVVLTCLAALAAAHGQVSDHANDLLNGQLLWANAPMLIPLGVAALLVLTAQRFMRHPLLAFYLPFAMAVTLSVQVVGVYLVFASLIFPALAAGTMPGARRGLVAFGVGAAGYLGGLLVSLQQDMPAGPTVVVSLALAAAVFSGGRYFIARRLSFRYNPGHQKKSQEHQA